jgi:hypothetical protein
VFLLCGTSREQLLAAFFKQSRRHPFRFPTSICIKIAPLNAANRANGIAMRPASETSKSSHPVPLHRCRYQCLCAAPTARRRTQGVIQIAFYTLRTPAASGDGRGKGRFRFDGFHAESSWVMAGEEGPLRGTSRSGSVSGIAVHNKRNASAATAPKDRKEMR